jgi:conjugal transfer pilus assembly protein TraW
MGGCSRKGDVLNPLKTVPFMQTLYFIDGDDPDQVAWMKRQVPDTLISKIILVKGSVPDTSVALDARIYFDQNGVLKTVRPDQGAGAHYPGALG